jgi:LysM repeat protein
MIDSQQFESDQDIRFNVLAAFQVRDPDPVFVEHLKKELIDQFKVRAESTLDKSAHSQPYWIGQLKQQLSPLLWAAIAVILIISLIWGINNLIPGGSVNPSPSPTASVAATLATLSTPSLDKAIFYIVEEGDTLSSISEKTNVPQETLESLNSFVLQINQLSPRLQLVIGFNGQSPIFYTVQPGDTVQTISDKAGISLESFATLNRIRLLESNEQTPLPITNYILKPGMKVIIDLQDNTAIVNEGNPKDIVTLSEVDLDCDGNVEHVLGIESPEIEYFNIKPQLAAIMLERTSSTGFQRVWEQTADELGVSYMAYTLFAPKKCNQFLVIVGHKGKESVTVYRWDGEKLINVLTIGGRFLFEGSWMEDVFGDYKSSPNILFLGEFQQQANSSNNIWILRGYQWIDGGFELIEEKRVEANGGG